MARVLGRPIQLRLGRRELGYAFTANDSSLPAQRVRLRAWAQRVRCLHSESGRFLVEPNGRYFVASLPRLLPLALIEDPFYRCPRRLERLRRLAAYLRNAAPGGRCIGGVLFRRLALRLDAAGPQSESSKMWRHQMNDFDELWRSYPIFAQTLSPFQHRILALLCSPLEREFGA